MNNAKVNADHTNDPVFWNHSQAWTKEDFLRETKTEVYRRLLSRTLQYHRQTHRQLLDTVRTKGLQELILKQWLALTTGSDAVLRILQSLKKDTTMYHHLTQSDKWSVASEGNASGSDEPIHHNLMRPGKDSQLWPKTRKETSRMMPASTPMIEEQYGTQAAVLRPTEHKRKSSGNDNLLSFLITMVRNVQNSTSSSHTRRLRRSQEGVMYLPVGGSTQVQCPTAADAAGVSISQMAFLSVCLTIFSIIVNINNNINNNNNNNNINSDSNLSNNNAQLSLNVNNAAQVNVMLPPPIPGRRRRSSLRAVWRHVLHNTTAHTLHLSLQELLRETQAEQKWEMNQEAEHKQDMSHKANENVNHKLIKESKKEVTQTTQRKGVSGGDPTATSSRRSAEEETVGMARLSHAMLHLPRRRSQPTLTTPSANLNSSSSAMITRLTVPGEWNILDDSELSALLQQTSVSHALGGQRIRRRAQRDVANGFEEHSSHSSPAHQANLPPGWGDRRVTAEGMGEVRGPCKGVSVTQDLQQGVDTSEESPKGIRVKTKLRKDADVSRDSEERAGLAARLLRAMGRWMKASPLASPACRGLQLCGSLRHRHPHPDVWLTVLASFAAYQRVSESALSLHQFVRSAVRGRGCHLLFPTCRQTLTI
ncbi:uncharacterized protein [Panulirus ornatus]|uniref:uncharacterized protein n=1 Tax=Panulirus ornatus TaxID=150431 RepID=UPI003A84C02C